MICLCLFMFVYDKPIYIYNNHIIKPHRLRPKSAYLENFEKIRFPRKFAILM